MEAIGYTVSHTTVTAPLPVENESVLIRATDRAVLTGCIPNHKWPRSRFRNAAHVDEGSGIFFLLPERNDNLGTQINRFYIDFEH